jgi:diguanylate cyclase (GGDEF)-like protein
MQQMLQSLLDSCVEAVQADCGVLWMISQGQDRLQPAYRRGLENQPLGGVSAGDGLAGLVLLERSSRLQHAPDAAFPAPGEPSLPEAAGVPLFADGHVRGVLAVYRRDASDPFDQEDLETLQFLVQQGEVAMENILLHEEARRLSLTDGLTGVWNRRYLQMQFRQMVASAMRFGRPFSVLMLDLDHFKAVNDTYGHPRGDAVLVEFTRRVKGVLREVDVFGRYGGEEFVCLLSETGLSGATATAGKIIHEIRSRPFHEGAETPLDITVSIGVASYPRHGSTFQALIAAADGALYNAKRNGRDRFETANEPVAVKGSANTAPDGGSSEPAP